MKRVITIVVLIAIIVIQFSNPGAERHQGIDSDKLNISGEAIKCK